MNKLFSCFYIAYIFIIVLLAFDSYAYQVIDYNDLYRSEILDISIQEPYNFFGGINSIQPNCDIFDLSDLLSYLIASMLDVLDSHKYTVKILLEEEKVAGFIIFKIDSDLLNGVNFVGINGLAISDKYRQRGYGRALLSHVINIAKVSADIKYIHLTVNVNNLPARRLYVSEGFTEATYTVINNIESISCYKYL